MRDLVLDVDDSQLSGLAEQLGATREEIHKALGSTLNKMSAWVKGRVSRGLAPALGIKLGVVRDRVRAMRLVKSAAGDRTARIWIGLNPVDLMRLSPRKIAGGIQAGPAKVAGGFLAPGATNQRTRVFKRVGEKRRMTQGRYVGKMRQPLEKQSHEIEKPAEDWLDQEMNRVLDGDEFMDLFTKTFEHELQWRIQKRK